MGGATTPLAQWLRGPCLFQFHIKGEGDSVAYMTYSNMATYSMPILFLQQTLLNESFEETTVLLYLSKVH